MNPDNQVISTKKPKTLPTKSRLQNAQGKEGYVTITENGQISFRDESYLRANVSDDLVDVRFTVGGVREVERKGNDNRTSLTRDIAVKYPDGSVSTIVPVFDVILEYRTNIGNRKERTYGGASYESIYGVNTISLGLKLDRYHQIMRGLAKHYDDFIYDEDSENISNGYIWIDAATNVKNPREAPESREYEERYESQTFMRFEKQNGKQVELMHQPMGSYQGLLRSLESNIIGIGFLSFRLKYSGKRRDEGYTYRLGATIKCMQVYDLTTISSPGINTETGTGVGFSGEIGLASSELMARLKASADLSERQEMENRKKNFSNAAEDEDDGEDEE
ncbi:hypothetical protein HDV06_000810 [Boothiomyces sp. JEL0866]|nr:hypothetical protein HDV06_000810 [Boothiomyces sp. JEL0866]